MAIMKIAGATMAIVRRHSGPEPCHDRQTRLGSLWSAIGLLVGALILAYNNSETFRNILDKVFGVVKKVVDFLRPIGAAYFDGLKLAFNAIKTVLSGYAKIVMGVFDAFKTVYNFLKPITSKAFDGIKAAFNVIKKPVDLLITALRKAKELFQWFTSIGRGKNTPTVAIGPTTPGTGLPPGFQVESFRAWQRAALSGPPRWPLSARQAPRPSCRLVAATLAWA
jgi:hypothetical protein